MRKITADEFRLLIAENPAWAAHIDHPIEITTPCVMPGSHITQLSPWLTFNGADFTDCKSLKSAEATFKQSVILDRSGITTTKGINVTKPDARGVALSCIQCEDLEEITGTFPGAVIAVHNPSLKTVQGLVVTHPDNQGEAANFSWCPSLKTATGKYAGHVNFSTCKNLEKIEDLWITRPNEKGNAANFTECVNLKEATGKYPGNVNFTKSGVSRIRELEVTGENIHGISANFNWCAHLEIAEGSFYAGVSFERSNIKRVGKLNATPNIVLLGCKELIYCPEEILLKSQIDKEIADNIRARSLARKTLKQPQIEL